MRRWPCESSCNAQHSTKLQSKGWDWEAIGQAQRRCIDLGCFGKHGDEILLLRGVVFFGHSSGVFICRDVVGSGLPLRAWAEVQDVMFPRIPRMQRVSKRRCPNEAFNMMILVTCLACEEQL